MPRWLVIALAILFFPVTVIVLIVRSKWTPRTKGILTTAWIGFLLILSAAGNGSSSSNAPNFASHASTTQHSAAPDVGLSPAPSHVSSPSPKPTPTPSPSPQAPVAHAFVTFLDNPGAHRGAHATALVRTTPNTYCTIEVDYKSGPSTAQGLAPKTSSATGAVSWTWLVGSRTTPGDWPIVVNCGDASGQTYVHVT